MKEKRILKFYFKKNSKLNKDDYDLLLKLTKESTKIYNYANYIVRQKFFSNQQNNNYDLSFYFEYEELKPLFDIYLQDKNLFNSTLSLILCKYAKINNFKLNSKMVQGIYRKLNNDWKSYFALLKKKQNKTYDKKVKLPNYKKENHSLVEFNIQTISKKLLKNNYIGIVQFKEGIKLPKFINKNDITSFRANYKKDRIIIEVIYEKDVKDLSLPKLSNTERTASIDIGLNQLATITFNFNHRPIVVNGKPIKTINQFYNKNIAKQQTKLPKNVFWSQKLNNITLKREVQLYNLIHYNSNLIVNLFKKLNVKQVIIGKNKEWKQSINLGKRNNQSFVFVPFERFINTLEYKLNENGIFVYRQEESYTSKANFLNNDFIPTYNNTNQTFTFTGTRIKRGLYKDNISKKLIHADVNGSFNIMRKADIKLIAPLAFLDKTYIFPLNIEKVS